MNKIGIVTFHRANNYGAALQSIALQRYIASLGYDAELIDYVDQLYDHYKISYKTNNIFKSMVKMLLSGKTREKIDRFRRFLESNSRISARSYTKSNISSLNEAEYKCFFTGSDQVFNPRIVNFDDTYLLSFVNEKLKCNSYAASIGLTEMSQEEIGWLKGNIYQFNNILIREESAKQLLEKNGIKNSILVCDPTLLISDEEWESMEHRVNMPDKYILYYGFKKNDAMEICSADISKDKGLPIYIIGDALRFKDSSKKQLRGVGPAEWLWLVHHAEYVITNSFHGMIFSFIYGKQVWVADSDDGTFSRMEDFLEQMNCSNRIISCNKKVDLNNCIDYDITNVRLKEYIINSKNILKNILNS